MGFSAGGHLVASLALKNQGQSRSASRQLDAQVLVYPCIDGSDWVDPESCGFFNFEQSFSRAESLVAGRKALLGGAGFAAPPTFLVASTVDEASAWRAAGRTSVLRGYGRGASVLAWVPQSAWQW